MLTGLESQVYTRMIRAGAAVLQKRFRSRHLGDFEQAASEVFLAMLARGNDLETPARPPD